MAEQYVGKGISRHDAIEKVTGQAVYVDDITMTGMLHAAIKTSTQAHAKIIRLDVEKARALPGVKAVITAKEAPYKIGLYMVDRPVLADGIVRYYGEAVAAVAATSIDIAREAVALIEVEYEPLPYVSDPVKALEKDSPLVHENIEGYTWVKNVFFPEPGTNIANLFKVRKGDVDKAFEEADLVMENVYAMPQVFHVPLETHACISQWGLGDKVKIWTSAQSPFAVRSLFCYAFQLPEPNVTVTCQTVGGGFGGKSGIHLEPVAALLSRAARGVPVKLISTREDECMTLPCRQGLTTKLKTGVTKDGKIIAEKATYYWDAGAYADYGVNIGRAGGYAGAGPYDIDNSWVDSYTIYTDHVFGTAYRGFGHPEVFWAIERQRELLARALHMDPLEFRLKNVLMPGSKTITGEIVTQNTGRVDKCLKKVAESIGFSEPYQRETGRPGVYRGKAVATLHKAPAMPTNSATSAVLFMNEDGSVRLDIGGIDMGQGTYTVMQQIVAERLKLPIEKVTPVYDTCTDTAPYDWQTVASRMTVLAGNAVIEACDDLTEQLLEIGALALHAAKHEVALGDEMLYVKQNPHMNVPLTQVVMGYTHANGNSVGGPLIGRGKSIAQGLTFLDQETGQGRPALDWTFGAHGVDLELDTNTGEIQILKISTCIDVGHVMNEMLLKGQVIGGVVQGLGTVSSEYVQYAEDGRLITKNLVDYKIPTMKDIPEVFDVLTVETPQLDGPYGARGCGEHPLISVTTVIANALQDACGLDIRDLPMSAQNLRKAWKSMKPNETKEDGL